MDAELAAYLEQRTALLGRTRCMIIAALRLDLEPSDIDPDTPLVGAGLGADSIDVLELIVALDKEFGLKFPPDQSALRALRTVNCIVDYVLARQAEGNHGP
jgi:acyl carrier protein